MWRQIRLILRHRSGWISPAKTVRCQRGRFRFISPPACCQVRVPDCHSVRTSIPYLPLSNSLGAFHSITARFLSLFCKCGFTEISPLPMAMGERASLPDPRTFTQGRLRCTQHTILCTALQVILLRTRPEGGQANYAAVVAQWQVSAKIGTGATCHCGCPRFLTPSTHPKLGVTRKHQGLHRYALQRIFRPFLKTGLSD